jgi:hypothetical protein
MQVIAAVMQEGRRRLLVFDRPGDPRLNAVQAIAHGAPDTPDELIEQEVLMQGTETWSASPLRTPAAADEALVDQPHQRSGTPSALGLAA